MACGCGTDSVASKEWQDFVKAIDAEDSKLIKKLVRNPVIHKNNPVLLSINLNKNKSLSVLLQCGLSPNKSFGATFNTPLHAAVLKNNLAAVRLLLSHGADIEKTNVYRFTAFLSALENADEETVSFFVHNFHYWRNILNMNLYTELVQQCPILALLRNRQIDATRHIAKLLRGGVGPNTRNSKGNTPILQTLYTKDSQTAVRIIKTFTRYDTYINYMNFDGISPLFKVITLDDPNLLQVLVEFQTLDINQTNMFGLNSVYYAASNTRNNNIIRILMKAGADPLLLGAFTMRGLVQDTASVMLAAVTLQKYTMVEIFFEFGFCMKRRWFKTRTSESIAWSKMSDLSKKVPTLLSLARKSIKKSLASNTRIPSRASVAKLELPRSLASYLQFY